MIKSIIQAMMASNGLAQKCKEEVDRSWENFKCQQEQKRMMDSWINQHSKYKYRHSPDKKRFVVDHKEERNEAKIVYKEQ